MSTYSNRIAIEQAHPEHELDASDIRRLVRQVADREDCSLRHVSIVLSDRDTVLQLNREYLEHDYPTDVLSFPLHDDPSEGIEGEIYIDLDTADERHEEFDATFKEEVHRYIIHGLLHLVGYDDASPSDRTAMRDREDHYLNQLG